MGLRAIEVGGGVMLRQPNGRWVPGVFVNPAVGHAALHRLQPAVFARLERSAASDGSSISAAMVQAAQQEQRGQP